MASDRERLDGAEREGEVVRRLPYRSPLDGAGLLEFLGRRAVPGLEEVHDGAYRRSLRLSGGEGIVELQPREGHVLGRFVLQDPRDLEAAVQRCRRLLDLDCDPPAVLEALAGDALLGRFVRAVPGRRVPGTVDAHELAFRALLGQQISVAAAVTHTRRLVLAHGRPLTRPRGRITHLFPSAAELTGADERSLAMPAARRRAILTLAEALASGGLELDAGADRRQTRRQLLALPGIGPWTAGYVAIRALGDPDAFIAGDLGVRRALEALGHDGRPAAAAELAQRWRPYRAYALVHLWATLGASAAPAARLTPAA